MQNPLITSTLYFPKQSNMNKYKGLFELKKNQYLSPAERRIKER